MRVHVRLGACVLSCGLTRARCNTANSYTVVNGCYVACMHVSASTHAFTCHELSHAHDLHAQHAQALGAEGLCQESLSGALNGRAGNALNLHVRAIEGSHDPSDSIH